MKNFIVHTLFLGFLLLIACGEKREQKPSLLPPIKKTTVQIAELKDTIWIAAVGDVVPASDYDRIALPPNNGQQLFTDLVTYIQSADLAFANFEGVLSGCDDCEARKCNDRKYCYRFRIPEIYATRVKEAGFDFLNIACNHIEDFGVKGRVHTHKRLLEMGFFAAGIEQHPCIAFEMGGMKYGFCAFAQFQGCSKMRNSSLLICEVKKMVESCDLVIVSLHGGAEGPKHRNTPREDEEFLEFNRGNMYKTAHLCIDAGADLIIGTGPHVARAVELYKNRFIMYSLGNFCTYGPFGHHVYTRHAPLMRVGIDAEGNFLAAQIIPIKQIEKGLPRYDSAGLAIQHLKELTTEDFPKTPLTIGRDGWIRKLDK